MTRPIPRPTAQAPPIDLALLERVARGRNRDIYLLPQGHGDVTCPLVLKVPRYADRSRRQSGLKRLAQRLFPASATRVIRTEAQYAQTLMQAARSDADTLPLPKFYGFVATSDGIGALWEAICDAKGTLAPTLEDITSAGRIAEMIAQLNAFAAACYSHNIVAPDINDRNLALRQSNGVSELVLIDGFGDHRMISLRQIWPARNTRSLDDRFRKVARKTGLAFDCTTHRFTAPG